MTTFAEFVLEVQEQGIFSDSKVFVDAVPKKSLEEVLEAYHLQKSSSDFSLRTFVEVYFDLPQENTAALLPEKREGILSHIDALWDLLTKSPDLQREGSLLPLPYAYIVPGGRFREIYYWDSYFTMLGLAESGRWDLIESMVKNFAYLVDTYGLIPNGNRTYYLTRSQPPFFALMVRLLTQKKKSALKEFLPSLEREYRYWMTEGGSLVQLPDGTLLNRFWDSAEEPRPEGYKEDVHIAARAQRPLREVYRNLRAGAASGMDFSSRWFRDRLRIESIDTINYAPVDLNALLGVLEETLAEGFRDFGDLQKAEEYDKLAHRRIEALTKYFWNEEKGFFADFDLREQTVSDYLTAVTVTPLFLYDKSCFPIHSRAGRVASAIEHHLLQSGGVVVTEHTTGEQWDWPNGWAPHQWMAIEGFARHGFPSLAEEIATRWATLNKRVYLETGKLMEKYDVVDTTKAAGGGEYPAQDGFGWTNGVLRAIFSRYPALSE